MANTQGAPRLCSRFARLACACHTIPGAWTVYAHNHAPLNYGNTPGWHVPVSGRHQVWQQKMLVRLPGPSGLTAYAARNIRPMEQYTSLVPWAIPVATKGRELVTRSRRAPTSPTCAMSRRSDLIRVQTLMTCIAMSEVRAWYISIDVFSQSILGMLSKCKQLLCPYAAFRSSNYLCSFSAFFGGCAARIHATFFCCTSWHSRFLSPQRFVGGQC
jgi:hypothetical protein